MTDETDVTLKILTRGPSQSAAVTVKAMLRADGAWVPLTADHPLVRSAANRYYWRKKTGCVIEIAVDTESGQHFARLVRL